MPKKNGVSGPRCVALVGPYGAGKTTLLESILWVTGAIQRKGSIAAGNTVGDASPEARAYPSRRRSGAGGAALPGSDMPIASAAEAMVLAVNWPPQAPAPGQAAFSMASSSDSSGVCLPSSRAAT